MTNRTSDVLVPLQRVLAANGVRVDRWALDEACEGERTLPAFARCARRLGLETKLLQLNAGDLPFVPVGTLVALDDGAFATVRQHAPAAVVLETEVGAHLHVGPTSSVRPQMALHLQAAQEPGEPLLARLRARLGRDLPAARAIGLATISALAFLGLGLAAPMLVRVVLGAALPDRAPHTLGLVAAVTALLGLQVAYVGWLRRRAIMYLGFKLSEHASFDVTAHLLRLPFAEIRELELGTIQQAVGSAVNAAEAIPSLVPQLVDGVLGVGYLGYVLFLDPMSGAIAGLMGLVMVAFGILNGRRRLVLRRELLARTRAERQTLYETIIGIETVKAENAEGRMLERWLGRLVAEEEAALTLNLRGALSSVVLSSCSRIAGAAVLLLMARQCLAGLATVADLVAAVQASAAFIACAQSLAALPPVLSTFRSDRERADEALRLPVEKLAEATRPSNTRAPALVLRDVWFRYDDDAPWVLSGFDFVAHAGETALLTWPSGAGKSTLLRIMAGLLEPGRGDALVFGLDAAQARRLVTYIPQHAALLAGSIMENLRILSRGAPHERILDAARTTGLTELVAAWPMKLDTMVSRGSTNLSSGQRQIVLLTAAVASEAPIVLLDEALAHVDLGLRAKLGRASLFPGRTVIAVAHDASKREASGTRIVEPDGTTTLAKPLPPQRRS